MTGCYKRVVDRLSEWEDGYWPRFVKPDTDDIDIMFSDWGFAWHAAFARLIYVPESGEDDDSPLYRL
jgi:hypothetical protein